jgi:hypothetical protein
MANPVFSEAQRKAVLRAMAKARKLGYFAKLDFKFDGDIAKDAIQDRGLTQFVYSLKPRAKSIVDRDFVIFYWAGDGQKLVDLLRAEGLKVEWEGEVRHSIQVYTQSAA